MTTAGVNDPFASDEPRTFIKPNPGGRASAPRPLGAAAEPGDALPELPELPELPAATGLNPLVALANPLLLVVTQLRSTRHVDDPVALRSALAHGVRDFVARATRAQIGPERVMAARYVLCTLIDEAASDTPWGGAGAWADNSLLTMFHNEASGGERVFQLMARLAEKPAANRDLLELIYSALVLGFEGRYRVLPNGAAQLDAVRDRLAQILTRERGDFAPALAQHWAGCAAPPRRALSWLPLAASAALLALGLVAVHWLLAASLNDRSDPVYAQIQNLRLPAPVSPLAQAAPQPRLAQFLQSDIKAGLLAVRDEVDRSVVTIRGDGLFAPASAVPIAGREALLGRLGEALARVGGQVLVTGHTDNAPMRSARFPSNWHLSEARAQSVRDLLVAHHVPLARISADGRADSEPLASNASAAGMAQNRRVEVTLIAGRAVGTAVTAPEPGRAPAPPNPSHRP